MKYYRCPRCGNIAIKLNDSGVNMVCCGGEMEELIPNTTDAAEEKHIPIIDRKGEELFVIVGEVMHPMTSDHMIEWIYVETTEGGFIHYFKENDKPVAKIPNAIVKNVYSYCNLHGLWKLELK